MNFQAAVIITFTLFFFFLLIILSAGIAFRHRLHELWAQLTLSLAGCAAFVCLVLFIVFFVMMFFKQPPASDQALPFEPSKIGARNVDIPLTPREKRDF